MRTNREKYDHICSCIKAKDQAAIRAILPAGAPGQFYTIEQYEAKPMGITSISRYRRGFCVKSDESRITKADIETAAAVLSAWAEPLLEEIFVHYSYKQTYGTVSGAHPYSKIEGDVSLAWTAEALLPEIERRRALYAPRDGHEPCTYCRKQTPSEAMVSHTILYRDRGGLARKTCRYCSATCGGYDQMGHEG